MSFCLVEEDRTYKKFILSTLININFLYETYNICIACSDDTKKYISNFPIYYKGNIKWLILENLDENNIRYGKNILYSIKECIKLFNNALYIDCRIDLIDKLDINDDIKRQEIGFVSRKVNYVKDNNYQKYITNIFYISNIKFIDTIEDLFNKNIDEWKNFNYTNYEIDELKKINIKFVNYFIRLPLKLKELFNLTYFFTNDYLISSEDFFAFDNKILLKDINNLKIQTKNIYEISKKKDNYDNESGEIQELKLDEYINIKALNIRVTNIDNKIIDVNKELYNRLAQHNILNMLLINLKYANSKIEFVIPNKNGIGIWNRKTYPSGMYELIDMITTDNDYFGKVETNVDYFSFNNFVLMDKPHYYALNNNIKKYSALFLCNYDNSIEKSLYDANIKYEFGFYYSNYPKMLEEYAEKNTAKSRFCIEINKNKIIEWELSKEKINIILKKIININNDQDKIKFLSQSMYCLFNEFDSNLLANCFGLKCIPIFKNSIINLKLYDIKLNENVFFEPDNWNNFNNYDIISFNNHKYYQENIIHTKIITKLLNKILKFSDIQKNSN